MANKILIFDKLAFDSIANPNQYFALKFIDLGAGRFELRTLEQPTAEHPALADLIDNTGDVLVTPVAFPVGAVFISAVPTNPAILLGYGTWVAFAAGRVLVGLDVTDPSFDTLEKLGGAKTVTLTTAQMPAHTHTQAFTTNPTVGSEGSMGSDGPSDEGFVGETASTGEGGSHNNLQPYIVVRFWKRIG